MNSRLRFKVRPSTTSTSVFVHLQTKRWYGWSEVAYRLILTPSKDGAEFEQQVERAKTACLVEHENNERIDAQFGVSAV